MSKGTRYIQEAYDAIFNGDYNAAIMAFHKALQLEPTNASYYYKLSVTYARNGRLTEALRTAETADKLVPNHSLYSLHYKMLLSSSYVGKAIDLYTEGKNEQRAMQLLEKAILLNPLHTEAHYWLALILFNRKEYRNSYFHVTEVLRLQPLHRNAATLLLKINDALKKWH